jgi:hypothetical protein
VPPPPVTGASVGNGLADGLGLADGTGVGETLTLTDTDGLGLTLVLTLAEELARLPLLDEALALTDAVPLTLGVSTVTDADGEPLEVQAESATEVSTVIRPPTAASLTRCAVHAMAVRAFIEPPRAPGNDHFPAADRRNRRRKETARPAFGRRPR